MSGAHEEPHATLQFGRGRSVASYASQFGLAGLYPGPRWRRAFRFADRHFGTDFGELTAARDVRS